ncbi:RNA polymerase, sigma-24 subunit, ECF subfamily [Peptoclostridium acidaminophilum DSM 3953]|uniref:RNA polymerase, sigma-24 subunit, ECF subfamily n=1 Tax=Peptoclostridium acidaminophilum DSM 3953 TaxID=1286171 RepID=W8U4U7_PEPAC|nr:sigma-70 family RNA polymerase sigma factor [Peptoclostridium acidaminophilum]AHM55976.1 RNA polymerase, sigma-24 subunit, ECF subfamily [Peptoclostridium acidaminophilum DSM 3953]
MDNINFDEMRLVRLSQEGDVDSFERLIESHKQRVYNIALRMVKNREDAFDVSQEVFIRVYKSIGKFGGKSSFSTWLYRITVNCCLDHLKKEGRYKYISDVGDDRMGTGVIENLRADETPESVMENRIKQDEIKKALKLLDSDFRAAVVLRDIQGFSYDEISRITNANIGTVKSRISRGRRRLREIYTELAQRGDKSEL